MTDPSLDMAFHDDDDEVSEYMKVKSLPESEPEKLRRLISAMEDSGLDLEVRLRDEIAALKTQLDAARETQRKLLRDNLYWKAQHAEVVRQRDELLAQVERRG